MTETPVAGWTPLHFAALHAPPTLVSYLLTHAASPLSKSHRGLTPLDVITAYEEMPTRADIAFLLEQAMRERGWYGSEIDRRRERKKRRKEMREQKMRRRRQEWGQIGHVLSLPEEWWGEDHDDTASIESESESDSDEEKSDEEEEPTPYTPTHDHDSILVFSLSNLPQLLDSLISNVTPILKPLSKRTAPANGLYYLARFAAVWCDNDWVEEVVIGAVDKIEETVHAKPEDLAHLAFWLFNTTTFLHLLRCDHQVNAICEELELFELLEEMINAVFVFVIRVVEKRIDPLIDTALLDHSPLASEFDSVKFEDEWNFFRSLTSGRKKTTPASPPQTKASPSPPVPQSPTFKSSGNETNGRPASSSISERSSIIKPFASLRFSRATASVSSITSITSTTTVPNRDVPTPPPTSNQIPNNPNGPSPATVTSILTALHTLLSLYGINPALIVQANSQIFYWTSSELFNRLISRKRYLCRSRAMQVGMNVGVLEEWVARIGLPRGISSHFTPVRQLLSWLQRQREQDEELPSSSSEEAVNDAASRSSDSKTRERDEMQLLIDNLFDPDHPKSEWTAPKPPEALGELMNSRYMIPLIFPSDPALIVASSSSDALHPPAIYTAGMDSATILPVTPGPAGKSGTGSLAMLRKTDSSQSRSSSRASHTSHASVSSMSSVSRGPMRWTDQGKKIREVDVDLLDLVGGFTQTEWHAFGVRFLNAAPDMTVDVRQSISGEWHDIPEPEPQEGGQSASLEAADDDPQTTPSTSRTVNVIPDESPEPSESQEPSDARSLYSFKSGRSHLTPNPTRPTAEKRRSLQWIMDKYDMPENLSRESLGHVGGVSLSCTRHLALSVSRTPSLQRPSVDDVCKMSRLSSTCISRIAHIKGHLDSSPIRGGATVANPLILYDIKSKLSGGMGWSAFHFDVIRPPSRMFGRLGKYRLRIFVLNYKQIPYKTIWVSYGDIEPTLKSLGFQSSAISRTGKEFFTLPVISDPSPEPGGEPTLVVDSQVIAEYLDSKYPERPLLPEGTKALQAMFLKWTQTNLLPHFIQLVVPQVTGILDDPGAEYFNRTREKMFGKKLTDICVGEERTVSLAALEKELATLDGHIARNGGGDFLMGTIPSYADILLCSFFMWAKRVPTTRDPGFKTVFEIIKGWHGGRWERLQTWSEQFAEEN
ncbi:hypothetical protein M407DRAFT_3358 [Tulasnella calospora MUT 4182]|uniref:GST N-terminal domain-containing protein n=1 Tax=Tulasnella calospora MUT 4182 TaxID=1051891 RepID=A0A0C3LKT5_9AGAM|nr:hypothetical protein M407DRAFT_3358 [Tulasnella calospora MUT 4182]